MDKKKGIFFVVVVILTGFIFLELAGDSSGYIVFGPHGPGIKASLIGKPLGFFFIIWGIYFTYKIFSTRTIEMINYKCPACGSIFEKEKKQNIRCDECSSLMEELEGFYDRHPEFKDDKQ